MTFILVCMVFQIAMDNQQTISEENYCSDVCLFGFYDLYGHVQSENLLVEILTVWLNL